MNKYILLLACITGTITGFAQTNEAGNEEESMNIIKLNVAALAFKNISVQYERAIGAKSSVAATVRYMPKSTLPFRSSISDLADDAELDRQLANTEVGNFAIMPEFRYYFGRKAMQGFYLGPFIAFSRYNASLLYEYDDLLTTKTIPLTGNVNTVTGGLMIGAQWKLTNALQLDWWIAGPNYGVSRGNLDGRQNLSASEQQALRDELEDLEIPFTKFTYQVNSTGANIDFKGPWAGIRSGLCIGFSF